MTINSVNRINNNIINIAIIFVIDRYSKEEMIVEKSFINYIFIDLRGRDFKGLN